MKKLIAMTLALIMCLSLVPMFASAEASGDYYLVGYINGADYGIEGDSSNLGDYKFVDGKITVTFSATSYVIVKTGDNTFYMTEGWLGESATSATLAEKSTLSAADKLYVPAGTFTFTVTANSDGTLTLSYAAGTGSDDQGSNDQGSNDQGSNDQGSNDQGSNDQGSNNQGSNDQGSNNQGSNDQGSNNQGSNNTNGKYTLTVEVPSSWTSVNLYTWTDEPKVEAFGTYPGSAMSKASGNTYKCEIDGKLKYLILSNQDGTKTDDLTVNSGCDVKIVVGSDSKATISYPNGGGNGGVRKPHAADPVGELSNYRVVGNTDWLGNWNAAFDGGRMTKLADGTYRVNFKDVAPGSYEIKVTKDGKWGGDIGDNGNNYCFTVDQKSTITVDLKLSGDSGTIEVYGEGVVPKTGDISLIGVVILMALASVTAVVLIVNKKKFI